MEARGAEGVLREDGGTRSNTRLQTGVNWVQKGMNKVVEQTVSSFSGLWGRLSVTFMVIHGKKVLIKN